MPHCVEIAPRLACNCEALDSKACQHFDVRTGQADEIIKDWKGSLLLCLNTASATSHQLDVVHVDGAKGWLCPFGVVGFQEIQLGWLNVLKTNHTFAGWGTRDSAWVLLATQSRDIRKQQHSHNTMA